MAPKKVVKRNQKRIRWDQDVEILARLEQVASMRIQGAKPYQIATALGVNLRTAHRDISRVEELWRRESVGDIVASRDKSIAQYREIQTQAWERYRNAQKKAEWLRVVMDAEAKIVELQGTKATGQIDVTSKGEKVASINAEEMLAIAKSMADWEKSLTEGNVNPNE